MNTGKTLFAQLMDFLPWTTFTRIVDRYGGDHRVRTLSCAEQYRSMAFAQLTYRESLRDIETCLSVHASKLYHMGFRQPVRRSTLADANERRDWRIHAALAQRLITQARTLYVDEELGLDLTNTVYALDSTTIALCLSVFPWAHFRTTKAAVKMHTLLDLRGNIPSFIHISDGKLHDVHALDMLLPDGRPVDLRFIPARAGNSPNAEHSDLTDTVHPRACGEQGAPRMSISTAAGSSPRVRGTAPRAMTSHNGRRFIPARAGNRLANDPGCSDPAVHPRACGEQVLILGPCDKHVGSSPRVRGTVVTDVEARIRNRFIPARAGNSRRSTKASPQRAVHPRACGEQLVRAGVRLQNIGSSPRVRGTDDPALAVEHVRRFIPARAGNSGSGDSGLLDDAVHPRACGEQDDFPKFTSTVIGSSPRVRGTAPIRPYRNRQHRFIPARAGNSGVANASYPPLPVHPPRVRGTAMLAGRRGSNQRFIPARAGNRTPIGCASRCGPVHPRACGEQDAHRLRVEMRSGSSPRVRGTGPSSTSTPNWSRFIPARAGNRPVSCRAIPPTEVHPRACGEQRCRRLWIAENTGSSPRVRGTGETARHARNRKRFIPARAGNSSIVARQGCLNTVHPRACGEQPISLRPTNQNIGSSPRVRGTAPRCLHTPPPGRFIPARAGNRSRQPTARGWYAVHPRACGEQASPAPPFSRRSGSSPRVRGTVAVTSPRRASYRFIPARAGNSRPSTASPRPAPVHPRACGEQGLPAQGVPFIGGSSPRVRGTDVFVEVVGRRDRFIPARAGNSPAVNVSPDRPPVHPRACGEQASGDSRIGPTNGSSPRVRGTGLVCLHAVDYRRFIPARAGNSLRSGVISTTVPVHPRACGEQQSEDGQTDHGRGSSPRVRGTGRHRLA